MFQDNAPKEQDFKWYDWISKPTTVSVDLTPDQQQLILRIHDYGMTALNTPEKVEQLYIIIGKLKSEIHP